MTDARWTREDLAWLAGLFEGEGCITSRGARPDWTLSLRMTDFDVVRRAQNIAGFGSLREEPPAKLGYKPQLRWSVVGREKVYALLVAMWPWLGQRRRKRASEVLMSFRARQPNGVLLPGERAALVADIRLSVDKTGVIAQRHGVSEVLVRKLRRTSI